MRGISIIAAAAVSCVLVSGAGPARASEDCLVTGVFGGGMANFFETYSSCNSDLGPAWVLEQGWARPSFEWQVFGSGERPELTCVPEVRLAGVVASPRESFTYQVSSPGSGSFMTYGMRQPLVESVVAAMTATPGKKEASFKLDCGTAGLVSWSTPVVVVPSPPVDRDPGVSIEDGADYTNSKRVKLFLGWESGNHYDRVKVSNDGGFAPSRTREFELTGSEPVTWDLVDLGNERLPKTVYIKYRVGSYPQRWDRQIYTDDIILDTVKPQVVSASLSGTGSAALSASSRNLRVSAKDNRSGIASIQVSQGRPNKKAKVLKYRKVVHAPKTGLVFLRVRDGAGNWSRWHSAS